MHGAPGALLKEEGGLIRLVDACRSGETDVPCENVSSNRHMNRYATQFAS